MIKIILKKILFILTILSADEVNFTFDGWERECYLYKPSCIPDQIPDDFEPIPLVFMLHGLGGVGEDNYNFSALAEDSCFIVAFPQVCTIPGILDQKQVMILMIIVTLML